MDGISFRGGQFRNELDVVVFETPQRYRAHHRGAFVDGTIGALHVDAIEWVFRARDGHLLDDRVEFNCIYFFNFSRQRVGDLAVAVSHHAMRPAKPAVHFVLVPVR